MFALIVCSHTHTTNTHLTCTITEHNKQTKKQTNKRKKQTKKQTNKRKNKQTNEQTNTTMSSKTIFSSTWLDITSLSVKVGKRRRKKKKFDYLFLFSKVIQEKVQDGIRESATQKLCQSSKYIFFYHLTTIIYSGRLLMGSRIMGINRLMGSNWSHLTNPKLPFPTSVCKVHLLIGINRLLESVSLSPKVILLSGTHCNYNY